MERRLGSNMKYCLVVDDSRVIRKVACRILEDLDFEADEAEDGESALESCRARMPDVILLAGHLPSMNSQEFLRRVRAEKGGSRPVIVLCTTENDLPTITSAISAGANEYILKPFDRPAIESKFSEMGLV